MSVASGPLSLPALSVLSVLLCWGKMTERTEPASDCARKRSRKRSSQMYGRQTLHTASNAIDIFCLLTKKRRLHFNFMNVEESLILSCV